MEFHDFPRFLGKSGKYEIHPLTFCAGISTTDRAAHPEMQRRRAGGASRARCLPSPARPLAQPRGRKARGTLSILKTQLPTRSTQLTLYRCVKTPPIRSKFHRPCMENSPHPREARTPPSRGSAAVQAPWRWCAAIRQERIRTPAATALCLRPDRRRRDAPQQNPSA